MRNKITNITITHPGSGYTSSPMMAMAPSYGGGAGLGSILGGQASAKGYAADAAPKYNHEKMLKDVMAEFKNDPAVLSAVLKHADLSRWWADECERVAREEKRIAELAEKKRLRDSALSKLTDDEKRALGIIEDEDNESAADSANLYSRLKAKSSSDAKKKESEYEYARRIMKEIVYDTEHLYKKKEIE